MEHETWMPKPLEILVRSVAGFTYRSLFYGAGWTLIYLNYPENGKLFFLGVSLVALGFITEINPVCKMIRAEEGDRN